MGWWPVAVIELHDDQQFMVNQGRWTKILIIICVYQLFPGDDVRISAWPIPAVCYAMQLMAEVPQKDNGPKEYSRMSMDIWIPGEALAKESAAIDPNFKFGAAQAPVKA